MITYVDSSVLARAYLPDEPGHADAAALLSDAAAAVVTGTWTRVEVSGALVRAAHHGRKTARQLKATLAVLDADLGVDGPVTVVQGAQEQIEARALELVVAHGLRAMDAWHLAVADLVMRGLGARGEELGFATRGVGRAAVAVELGFAVL